MIDVSIISKIVSRKTEGEKIGKTPSAPGYFLDKSIWDSIFELKADSVGNKYLFGKLPLVTQYGITMFANGGNVDIPSIAKGLPYDNKTIWYNPSTNQIEVIGGTGGGGSFSGGVITGSGYDVLVINRTDRNRPTIGFQYNGSLYGYLGFSNADYPVFISSVGDAHQLLHSENYSSYALPLTGGSLKGTLQIPLDANGRWGLEFTDSYGAIGSDGTNNYVLPERGTSYIRSGNTDLYHRKNGNDYKIWDASNDGSDSGLDADLLDGMHLGDTYNSIPYVRSDGGIELGLYIDFHSDNGVTSDYTTRLWASGTNKNTVYLPISGGTLALTTDNVASATKLQTARTIWGQSFDGTGNVDGILSFASIDNGDVAIKFKNGEYINSYGNIRMYSINNEWSVGINNSPLFCVVGNGNVGIGTTSPAYRLDVVGNIHATTDCVFDAKIDCAYIYAKKGESIFATSSGYTDPLPGVGAAVKISGTLGQSGGNALLCTTSGNVGIGTTNPAQKLHVNGHIWSDGDIGAQSKIIAYGNVIAMGNIGVGTENPNYKLDVDGVIRSNGAKMYSYEASILSLYRTNPNGGAFIDYYAANQNSQRWRVGSGGDAIFVFEDSSNGNRLSLDRSGNLKAWGGITMFGSSDKRLKKNIRTFNASEELMKLGGVYQFEYNDYEIERNNTYKGTHVGLIYQNVKGTILDKMCYEREDGYGALNYLDTSFISLIAAVGIEHETRIQKLERENKELRQEVERLKSA